MKKFAVVSHSLPPSPAGQAIVLQRLLRDLPGEQYCLISCTNYENNMPGEINTKKLSGRYRFLKPEFQIGFLQRLHLSVCNILINSVMGIIQRAKHIAAIIEEERCEVIIACTGDLYDLPAAYLSSRWRGVPFIPYIFDDYMYQWTGFRRKIAALFEPIILKRSRAVIVPNEFMQREYQNRYGTTSTVIHNGCMLPDLDELDKTGAFFPPHETTMVYTGDISHAHFGAFRDLVQALNLLNREELTVHIFTSQDPAFFAEKGIASPFITFHPHVPDSQVPAILRQAAILFLPMSFDSPYPEVIKTSAPLKASEYLSVGRPILVYSPEDSFLSWYFKTYNCGLVVSLKNPELLMESLDKLITDKSLRSELSANTRKRAEEDFSIHRSKQQFYSLIKTC